MSDQLRKLNVLFRRRGLTAVASSAMPLPKTSMTVFEVRALDDANDGVSEPCALLFIAPGALGKADIIRILAFASSVNHVIVYSNAVSLQAMQILDAEHGDRFCEVLNYKDIVFDKPLNVLVPTYKVLNSVEIKDIERRRATTVDKFPIMLRSDAMARVFGFRPGDVVLAVETGCYRIVVR